MSSLLRPVGPKPPGVYWMRRTWVLAVVVLVLVLAWRLLSGLSGGDPQPGAQQSPAGASPVGTSSGEPATTGSSPTGAASPTDAPTGTPAATATGADPGAPACDDAAIAVEVAADSQVYALGATPKLTLTIRNTGAAACARDVGAAANTIAVESGGQAVWSSDDCQPGGDSNVVTLQPGAAATTTVTWDGGVTAGSCPSSPTRARSGAYEAVGRNGDVSSARVAFAIS